MLKKDEKSNPLSCFNKALDEEMVFVLLGRDIASSNAIEMWINTRLLYGKNKESDTQIINARKCAEIMKAQCKDSPTRIITNG